MTLGFLFPLAFLVFLFRPAAGDPQTNPLGLGCSSYNATDASLFLADLNATFSDLRSTISAGNTLSATSDDPRSSVPLYALFFCRSYLSRADCLACLSDAASRVRICGAATGGRAISDGCSLRYESAPFYDQGTLPGNTAKCANGTSAVAGFSEAVNGLVEDLSSAVPRIVGYSAAAERDGVYAYAQCAQTVSEDVCAKCLGVAYSNVRGCLPAGSGRAVDAGCFMRYSDAAFFAANQTVDLAHILEGGSRKTLAIFGGVFGGLVGVLVLALLALLWIRKSRSRYHKWKGSGYL